MDKNTTFLIVGGAGTMGLSTAYHLAKRGYTNITCIDRWPFPSRSSAGFDRNKAVRTEYADAIYTKLAHEAIELWRQPPFNKAFHETGLVYGTSTKTPVEDSTIVFASNAATALGAFDQALRNTRQYGDVSRLIDLPTPEALLQRFPKIFGNTPGFRGLFNNNAGWVEAANALRILGEECAKMGVKFIAGASGTAAEVLRENDEVVGVRAEDGTVHRADRVVMTLGAYSESVLDMEGQVVGCAYSITHVQMTPEEVERHKDMPVICVEGYGYTFPPDSKGVIKFCDLHAGHPYKQQINGHPTAVSIPRDGAYYPSDTLPQEDIQEVRKFIGYCMPQFENREFLSTGMCWDADSFDFNWIIGPHPSSSRLHIATGGSGHSFKNLPNVGKYVVESLEGRLSEEHHEAWRWRPDKVNTVAPTPRVDLADLHGWKHDEDKG